MGEKRRGRIAVALVTATVMAVPLTLPAQAEEPAPPKGAANGMSEPTGSDRGYPSAIPGNKRKEIAGAANDRALTTSGDGTGFHLLTAEGKSGYGWKTAASLSEDGFDADTWIGNACMTGSGKRAAVAYAPRTFTNKPELMVRGAFTAIVDLESGNVTKLPYQASLAYFSPGCGTGEQVVFTQLSHDGDEEQRTRLITVNAATGKAAEPVAYKGHLTSAIPTEHGIIAADGHRLVAAGKDGKRKEIAATRSVPFQLKADRDGGVTYIDRIPPKDKTKDGDSQARRLDAAQIVKGNGKAKPTLLASGPLTGWDLAASAAGTVFITGNAKNNAALPSVVKNPGTITKGSRISSKGQAAVTTAWADGKGTRIRPDEATQARTARTSLHILGTGKKTTLDALPGTKPVGGAKKRVQGSELSPALTGPADAGMSAQFDVKAASPTDPVESERTCAVPRNDPRKQAFQPTPRQVEWAVDQAVIGKLDSQVNRPANWKNMGMAAYSPQSLSTLPYLNGAMDRESQWHIPAQIMLGVTAQESNMWQATRFAVPGTSANSLIGNYYGTPYASDGDQNDPWAINWGDADCGYGIAQVTDGMRLSDQGISRSKTEQEAIALDYTANIAAGVEILAEKWNQTSNAGMKMNDGHPRWIENWTFALWAYNSGFYSSPDAGGHEGVGFTNNPANPLWLANRTPFLENASGGDDYSHAANPQHWPYQEKVIGWAARPIAALFAPDDIQPGYRAAWWNSSDDRTRAKPPIHLFCDESNSCAPSKIADGDSNDTGMGACTLDSGTSETNPHWLHCWWDQPVTWKDCNLLSECGYPVHRFNDTYPEQPDGVAYLPHCGRGDLPPGTLVVDNIPNGVTPTGGPKRTCGTSTSDGTFTFEFTPVDGKYPGKKDLHQIGAGEGNHFWFSHTRNKNIGHPTESTGSKLFINGKWTLNESNIGWSRVMVHIPDHGAHTRQAAYVVGGTDSTSTVRVVPQRTRENRWVSLGVFRFTGTPTVSLSTHTTDGTGDEDIAWDAVAFQKLPGKPKHQIVAMGDSFSSGEGVSEGDADYYPETNYRNTQNESTRNACHRSKKTWSRQAKTPGAFASIGEMADSWDTGMDYHLIACSGARTYNILKHPENGERAQIDKGYLDQNTSLVTISIGGNDSRFSYVIQKCLISYGSGSCQSKSFDNADPKIDRDVDGDGTVETERDKDYLGRTLEDAIPALITEVVKVDIGAVIERIHSKAPNAKIMLMGYPKLISGDASCLNLGPIGLSKESNDWLNTVAAHLTAEMKDAAAIARTKGIDTRFSDPTKNFEGKGICGSPESIHGMVKTLTESDNTIKDWPILKAYGLSAQSFHPKISGARLYADALEWTIDGWV